MECVVFVGVQASGKSAFFQARFADTHVRINLDMLKTRQREAAFLRLCLETGQRCVVDNTNPRRADRAVYVEAARAHRFRVVAYWFDVPVREALARNAARPPGPRVPVPGLLRTAKLLEPPRLEEGFEEIHRVAGRTDGDWVVERIASAEPPREP